MVRHKTRLFLLVITAAVLRAVVEVPFASGASDNACTRRAVGEGLCPELFLIGFQKAGSTALWFYLTYEKGHLGLKYAQGLPADDNKEIHFFDSKYSSGIEWYASMYGVRNATDEISMDATPDYTRIPQVPARIQKELIPDRCRFIVSIRDPVTRAYSWYKHIHAVFLQQEDYDAALQPFGYKFSLMVKYIVPLVLRCVESSENANDVHGNCAYQSPYFHGLHVEIEETGLKSKLLGLASSPFSDSLYGYILLHWFKYFNPQQFCVVVYEDLLDNFEGEVAFLKPCLSFYGKEVSIWPSEQLPKLNEQPCQSCDKLETFEPGNFKEIGADLHKNFFLTSNELIRSSLMIFYGRAQPRRWEDAYDLASPVSE
mmetsp:Transcript_6664/g.28450  ORF Transcript_6664/g.28450 Transcript_6664/m.28450 type:complete len:371 (-) Transcript_6664:996-2108(-)